MRVEPTHLLAAVSLTFVLAACAADDAHEPAVGSVAVAVVSTGPDGVTYRLPEGSQVEIARAWHGFRTTASLDGDGEIVSVRVPAGDGYFAELRNPDGELAVDWFLERRRGEDDVMMVAARLVTTTVSLGTIESGQTVDATFEFVVATGAKLTFNRGNVNVAIAVDEVEANVYVALVGGRYSVVDVTTGGDHGDLLAQRLPAADTSVGVSLQLLPYEEWSEYGGDETTARVCTPIKLIVLTADPASYHDLLFQTGFNLESELLHRSLLCVVDRGAGSPQTADILLYFAQNPVTSATFTDVDLYAVEQRMSVELVQRPFDTEARTLDLGVLMSIDASGTFTGESTVWTWTASGGIEVGHHATYAGQLLFQLVGVW
jgi:hypothetical protein